MRPLGLILCAFASLQAAEGCGAGQRHDDPAATEALLAFYVPGARLGDGIGSMRQRVSAVSFAPYLGYRAPLAPKPDGFEEVALVAGESLAPEQEVDASTPVNEVTLTGPPTTADAARRRVQEKFGDVKPTIGCRSISALGSATILQWDIGGAGALLVVPAKVANRDSASTTLTLYRAGLPDSRKGPNYESHPCS